MISLKWIISIALVNGAWVNCAWSAWSSNDLNGLIAASGTDASSGMAAEHDPRTPDLCRGCPAPGLHADRGPSGHRYPQPPYHRLLAGFHPH